MKESNKTSRKVQILIKQKLITMVITVATGKRAAIITTQAPVSTTTGATRRRMTVIDRPHCVVGIYPIHRTKVMII